ncbi:MAG: endonuclease domain-containing protein [Desulfuromonadales bacterium]|nr:endonuclease domain-containing protein [Desulfuromonadales bacterium]
MRPNQPPSVPPCQGGGDRRLPEGSFSSSPDKEKQGGHDQHLPEGGFSSSPDKGRRGRGLESEAKSGKQRGQGFLPYNKRLIAPARENRKNPTPAEMKIWTEILRMRQFAAFKFLRQKPIDNYIVDFYCSELRLVIEIDGESHAENVAYDTERTRVLQSLGLTVVRYTNNDIMQNIEGVYDNLSKMAGEPTPLGPPLSGGK